MIKLTEYQIETMLKKYFSDKTVLDLVDLISKRYNPSSLIERKILSVFENVEEYSLQFHLLNYQWNVISLRIKENVCQYSDNVIISINHNSEIQIFHCTFSDYKDGLRPVIDKSS